MGKNVLRHSNPIENSIKVLRYSQCQQLFMHFDCYYIYTLWMTIEICSHKWHERMYCFLWKIRAMISQTTITIVIAPLYARRRKREILPVAVFISLSKNNSPRRYVVRYKSFCSGQIMCNIIATQELKLATTRFIIKKHLPLTSN